MTVPGQWSQNRNRIQATRTQAPAGLGGGTNAQGSVAQPNAFSGARGAYGTQGTQQPQQIQYGAVQGPQGAQQQGQGQSGNPYLDAQHMLNMAQRAYELDQQRYQTAYDKTMMQERLADRSIGLQNVREQQYDQLFGQLGAGNMARSGAMAMGQEQIGTKYKQDLAELRRQFGPRAQTLMDQLMNLAEAQYEASKYAELKAAEEREELRADKEPAQFDMGDYYEQRKKENK